MNPSDPCRFAAYLPNCCDQARQTDGKTSTLATFDTPLPACSMPDRCECMTIRITTTAPPAPRNNVIPISRGRRQ